MLARKQRPPRRVDHGIDSGLADEAKNIVVPEGHAEVAGGVIPRRIDHEPLLIETPRVPEPYPWSAQSIPFTEGKAVRLVERQIDRVLKAVARLPLPDPFRTR